MPAAPQNVPLPCFSIQPNATRGTSRGGVKTLRPPGRRRSLATVPASRAPQLAEPFPPHPRFPAPSRLLSRPKVRYLLGEPGRWDTECGGGPGRGPTLRRVRNPGLGLGRDAMRVPTGESLDLGTGALSLQSFGSRSQPRLPPRIHGGKQCDRPELWARPQLPRPPPAGPASSPPLLAMTNRVPRGLSDPAS